MYQKPVRLLLSMEPTVTVLITGFEPFGGHETNISQLVVSRMAGPRTLVCPWTNELLQVRVEVDVLPVDSSGARRTAGRLHKGEQWDAILHVGLCDSCEVPRIERLAQDKLNMRMPDNAGRHVVGATLDGEGDRGCWVDTTVWNPALFPTAYTLSTDAGAYLCNETYHATLKALCEVGTNAPLPPPSIFLHLPGEKHMSIEDGEAFADACVAHLLRPYQCEPVHVVAAAVLHDGGYLVARRSPGEADAGQWEFPGGKCDPGEDWNEAIARELQEELSIEVSPRHPLGSWYRQRDGDGFVIHLIACELVDRNGAPSLTVHDASMWRSGSSTSPLSWAGRDGEMDAFLQDRIRST